MRSKRNKTTGYYHYNGWIIEPHGGHITIRRFCAYKNEKFVWAFRLADVVDYCDVIDAGRRIHALYLKPLYL